MNKISQYKGVSYRKPLSSGSKPWSCSYNGVKTYHATEREAAKTYDLRCVKDGKEPVNGTLTKK